MTPEAFKAWRKRLGLTQHEAARRLGVDERVIRRYETGRRGDQAGAAPIPKATRRAMVAIAAGLPDPDDADIDWETVDLDSLSDLSQSK